MVGQVIGAQGMAGLVQHRQLIWMEIGGAPREGDGLPEVAGGLSGLGDGGGEFQSGVLGGRGRMGVAGLRGGPRKSYAGLCWRKPGQKPLYYGCFPGKKRRSWGY